MNARIERDYRDLYRLAIGLQRHVEQLKGEVELLRARKGADGRELSRVWLKVVEKERRMWRGIDGVSIDYYFFPFAHFPCHVSVLCWMSGLLICFSGLSRILFILVATRAVDTRLVLDDSETRPGRRS